MKMKNVKIGMKVQVKELAPTAFEVTRGKVGIVYSIEEDDNSLRIDFPCGDTDCVDVSDVRKVQEEQEENTNEEV